MNKIILASQSPRRKQLLEWAEVPFVSITANTDEAIPASASVEEAPIQIALEKALVVKEKISKGAEGREMDYINLPILAADTVVVLDNEIIGKPQSRQEAIEILSRLSGRTHKVVTGVAILHTDSEICFSSTTEVTFHGLSMEQIEFYIDKFQPYDKAGAYAIQEWIGVIGIKSINGDFYNVMGLPINRVVKELEALGVLVD